MFVANRTSIPESSGDRDWGGRGQGNRIKVEGIKGVCGSWLIGEDRFNSGNLLRGPRLGDMSQSARTGRVRVSMCV